MRLTPRRLGWVLVVVAIAIVVAVGASTPTAGRRSRVGSRYRPFVWRLLVKVGLIDPDALRRSEREAIEELRLRGASITVFRGGDILVHFPLGELERKWRKEGMLFPGCGMAIAHSFKPDDVGPPMTDVALAHLDRLPTLTRVNLAGTGVTPEAIAAFRTTHPDVEVEEKDE